MRKRSFHKRMARQFVAVYHVTHKSKIPLITKHGLLPWLDRRGKGRVWLADVHRVCWAAYHVADTHGWDLEDLRLLEVLVLRHEVQKHRNGIFYVRFRLDPWRIGLWRRLAAVSS